MDVTLQLLLVEDNPADADLAREWLSGLPGVQFEITYASELRQALAVLRDRQIDAILLDLNLPDSQGPGAIRELRSIQRAPVVVLTGIRDGAVRMQALEEGAQDVVGKDEPASRFLARIVRYAHERHQSEEQHRRIEALVSAHPDAVMVTDRRGVVRFVNAAAEALFGRAREDLVGELAWFSVHEHQTTEITIDTRGERRVAEVRTAMFEWEGAPAYLAAIRDTTEQHRLQGALGAMQTRLKYVLESSAAVLYSATVTDNVFVVTWVSDNVEVLLGCDATVVQDRAWWESHVSPDDLTRVEGENGVLLTRDRRSVQYRLRHEDGSYRWMQDEASVVRDEDGRVEEIIGVWMDITERKSLEEQFLHAQRMEAVGRLAGGVAHDFNNLLTAILGSADLLRDDMLPTHPLQGEIDEIKLAAERGAVLTRQLLTFSRQQILDRKPLNVNNIMIGMERMLRRVIGEDVELVVRLAPDLGAIVGDAGQIEQIIVNLAVNARDAMPDGGMITIETANDDQATGLPESDPTAPGGPCVVVSFRDTGVGMDEETKAKIFEPFFTTKELGKGTGLGLATVYGIVEQSHGQITVHSEPGKGTTFRICFPRIDAAQAQRFTTQTKDEVHRGSERILLVEDDDSVRRLARTVLRRQGYTVVDASNGAEALRVAKRESNPVDLILTDVVMPGMAARSLVDRLHEMWPDARVLFTSGHTTDGIVHHGVLTGMPFLQKPFTATTLARKVREVLGPR